jgi:hypothetical protein
VRYDSFGPNGATCRDLEVAHPGRGQARVSKLRQLSRDQTFVDSYFETLRDVCMCVYICIYVCAYVCMHVCTCVCIYVHV